MMDSLYYIVRRNKLTMLLVAASRLQTRIKISILKGLIITKPGKCYYGENS